MKTRPQVRISSGLFFGTDGAEEDIAGGGVMFSSAIATLGKLELEEEREDEEEVEGNGYPHMSRLFCRRSSSTKLDTPPPPPQQPSSLPQRDSHVHPSGSIFSIVT
ncbi:MAG: hypothetical protein KBD00_00525 [Candidatus Peribacteraceae bacterium]|nr:hypothetical protein [Candidatus Peribacteraceae bacterium]